MRLFVKLIFAALVLAVLLPFTVLKDKTGKPLMSFSDLKMPDMSMPDVSMPDNLEFGGSNEAKPTSGSTLIYEWRDQDGNLNFTSEPPPPGIEYTTKGYDPNLNLIQSVSSKTETETETAQVETEQQPAANQNPLNNGNPYSPAKIEKLFDDAQKVQDLINERTKQHESLFNQNQ